MLTNFLNIQNVNDCKGTPLINYRYDFKNGLIKYSPTAFQRKAMGEGAPAAWRTIETGF